MTESGELVTTRTVLPERNLDLLRAIAVLLVVLDHTLEGAGNHARILKWLGQAGVQAFFVHTSLVLMASLERDGAPQRVGWVRRFYIRRAFRIYPLAWVVVAFMVVFNLPPGLWAPRESHSFGTIVSNFALVMDLAGTDPVIPAFWTLPIEMEMYLALPLCYLLARRQSWDGVGGLFAFGMGCAFFFIWGIQPAHTLAGMWRFQVLQFVPCFAMGVIAYWLLRHSTSRWLRLPSWVWMAIIVADILALADMWDLFQPHFVTRAIFCAVLGLTIPLVADAAPSILTRITNRIAVYSYGIYLVHQLALRLAYRGLKGYPLPLQLLVAIVTLTVVCYVAYNYIEKPGIKLGQRLAGGRPGGKLPLESTAPAP